MNIGKIINFIQENQTYFLISFLVFVVFFPHYNIKGEYVFLGMYYTPKAAEKKKNEEDLIRLTQKNTEDLKLSIIESSKKYNEVNKKYKDLETKYQHENEENEKLKEQVESLTHKLYQQEDFFTTKKKEDNKIKKVSFSNVSKKQVRNDRPEFGNSFSKAIKKTKKN